MKVRVKLYGTLSERLTPDERSNGIEMEIPEGATARDLLGLLGISEPRGGVVVVDGRVLGVDDEIRRGAAVSVFQAIGGG
jgi:sulfur carrier protein ThiS